MTNARNMDSKMELVLNQFHKRFTRRGGINGGINATIYVAIFLSVVECQRTK